MTHLWGIAIAAAIGAIVGNALGNALYRSHTKTRFYKYVTSKVCRERHLYDWSLYSKNWTEEEVAWLLRQGYRPERGPIKEACKLIGRKRNEELAYPMRFKPD